MFVSNKRGAAHARSPRPVIVSVLVALSILICPASEVAAGASALETSNSSEALPPYNFPYANGLYATIAGFLNVKDIELKSQKTYKLKIDSFKKKVAVKAILQRHAAPLVVVIPGLDGRADGRIAKVWPQWLSQAGYHVVSFDSTFLPSFIEVSGHGVTGNLTKEAERLAEIIGAFVKEKDVRDKITKIGIVGMSYGGIETLILGRMAREGRLSFKVDGLQAYSPPIKMHRTGELIDKWYREDRWQYTLAELADKLGNHKPVPADREVPFDDQIMRAGISAAFRMGLVDVIVRNDRMYNLGVLPRGNSFDDEYIKRDYAATWGYAKFVNDLAYPYWKNKLNLNDITELTAPTDLTTLLTQQPEFAQVIIAADDPFNDPADVEELKKVSSSNLVLLPRGGHLGFIADPWVKAKLLTLFNPPADPTTTTSKH